MQQHYNPTPSPSNFAGEAYEEDCQSFLDTGLSES